MPDWLWYAALGFNVGSAVTCWLWVIHVARRDRARWQQWERREDEQILRWSHVERCSACTAWLNEENARMAARGLDDDA